MREQRKEMPPEVKRGTGDVVDNQGKHREIGGTTVVVQTRRYRLITPLFGGGVEPAQADPVTLIRATEIRGQLRFWWRAIRGGQPEFEGKLDGMKAREDEIWGAVSKIDKREGDQEETQRGERVWIERVQIVVEVVDVGRTIKPFLVEPNKKTGKLQAWPCNDIPGYAAFPLRPPDELLKSASRVEDVLIKDLQQGVIFVLHISFPREWENDIQSALWAWETFGGVGARTRRGFGALQREQIDDSEHIDLPPPDPKKAEDWLREHLRYWVEGEKYPENVPYVGKNVQLQLKPFRGGSMKIWNELIDTLKRFRQERTTGQSGRSPWPEADAIRAITDKNPHHNASERPKKFPRAAFGLPIVFHFAKEKPRTPPDITLQGAAERKDRWASPLILRPLACQGGQALGLALVLQGSQLPEQMRLKLKNDPENTEAKYNVTVAQTQLTAEEARYLPVLKGQTNILQAFMSYLKEEGERR